MATIVLGTGGTLKSSTAEGRALEALVFLQTQEADTAKNSTGRNAITGTFSIEDKVFSGGYSLPTEQTISASGSLQIVASPYLQGVTFSIGSGAPTFKSGTIEGYVLEVLQYLQYLERNSSKNPTGVNNITGNFNSDTGLYTGTFSIPVSFSLDDTGNPVFVAVEYLLT